MVQRYPIAAANLKKYWYTDEDYVRYEIEEANI